MSDTATFKNPDGSTVEGRVRCAVEGPKIVPCYPLDHLLVRECIRQSPRVRRMPVMSRSTDGERDAIVIDFGIRALYPLCFCPFCGVELKTTMPEAKT